MRLQGKRAIVTGGSQGIGLSIAEAFVREGADVCLIGRDAGKLETARQQLGAGSVETISADLATQAGIDKASAGIAGSGRPVDILVNNAGVAFLVPFDAVTQEQFHQSLSLNVTAMFFLTQRLLPAFASAGASVINLSS